MAPRILISAGSAKPGSAVNYENAVRAAGGEFVTRCYPEVDLSFDGLLLTGGGDIEPSRYGQEFNGSNPPNPERDRTELALARAYLEAGKPVLGICRGHQILNVVLGGTMVQDLGEHLNLFHRKISADRVHPVRAQEGSILHALYGETFPVNSAHHQAVDALGEGLVVTARSESGVVESIELPGRPVLGVQFHPERMTCEHLRPDTVDGIAIFRWFLDQCK